MQKNDDNFRLFYCACKIDICHCSFVWDQPTQVFQSVIHAKYLRIFHNENRTMSCWMQVAMNPDNTVYDAKRLIGRRFDDPSVQSDMKHWPFEVINEGSKPKIRVEYKAETKTFFPEEISSMVLVKMKEIAEAYLGKVFILAFLLLDD